MMGPSTRLNLSLTGHCWALATWNMQSPYSTGQTRTRMVKFLKFQIFPDYSTISIEMVSLSNILTVYRKIHPSTALGSILSDIPLLSIIKLAEISYFFKCQTSLYIRVKRIIISGGFLYKKGSYKVWKIYILVCPSLDMGVCPSLEFDEIMLIYCLGYDFYKYGAN